MLHVVIGGAACGKSAWAENLLTHWPGEKIYLATMAVQDEEDWAKIEAHRKMRATKGFRTIECYDRLTGVELPTHCALLIECMSNLTANYLYRLNLSAEQAARMLLADLTRLSQQAEQCILIGNELSCDGGDHGLAVADYLQVINGVTEQLIIQAQQVTEVVYGIAISKK